jgi:plasmid stability protein
MAQTTSGIAINEINDFFDIATKMMAGSMASITIRNLDDTLKQRLRVRAAAHGRSMEEEAREILRDVVGRGAPPRDLAAAIRRRVTPLGGVELAIPEREPVPDPVRFDEPS